MGKVAGSYESVVRGVSQQVAQDRRSGQHAEQVNMISDPVRGLSRRHGSVNKDEVQLASVELGDLLADTAGHKVLPFAVGSVNYDLIHRTIASTEGQNTFAFAFNKTAGEFIPIVYASGDATLASLVSGGVSAAVNVGKYVFLAGHAIIPDWAATDTWGSPTNQQYATAWVRGPAYARTFKLTVVRTGLPQVVVSYKTASASYPGILDTSGISIYIEPEATPPVLDPKYQKNINDAVNTYNSAVTAWIGTAAADVLPASVAQQLVNQLVAAGVPAVRVDGTVCITDPTAIEVTGDDGGDGTLFRAVGNLVIAPDLVSTVHHVGKVVKIRPTHNNGDDAFYLKATPVDPAATGFTAVTWEEAAGYVIQPLGVIVMGTVVGGTLYLASSAAGLATLAGGTHPTYVANQVGDDITCPLPNFFGKTISYLGKFQDRLIIGSGSTLNLSTPGSYFNWFRQSVLTVLDDDPWEGYAEGTEADTITSSNTYDRNLILHGSSFWFEINGRQAFTPRTASITTGSAYKDANLAFPVSIGNFTMYSKFAGLAGEEVSSLHQVQAGVVEDSPDSTEISQQLDTYLRGKPVEIAAVSTPNLVFLRTDAYRNGLYVYGYLDQTSGYQTRILDNWHRWLWDTRVGYTIGISNNGPDLMVYMVKVRADGTCWVSAESFVTSTTLSDYPYADSLRPVAATTTGYLRSTDTSFGDAVVAFQKSSTYAFLGSQLSGLAALEAAYPANLGELWVGLAAPAFVQPTNPFIQDTKGHSVLTGRLTLGSVKVTVADTGGVTVDVTSSTGTFRAVDFSGRILANSAALVGRQPIVSTTLSATVGREIRECSYVISTRTWLPLTVTSIEWTGQVFNNVQRVQ